MKIILLLGLFFCLSSISLSTYIYTKQPNPSKKVGVCKDEEIIQKVDWACNLLSKIGSKALDTISNVRYKCQGMDKNFIWIHTWSIEDNLSKLSISFLTHPSIERFKILFKAPNKYGHNVAFLREQIITSQNKQKNGPIYIILSSIEILKGKKLNNLGMSEGAWSPEYHWTKLGDKQPTPKKSYLRKCKMQDTQEIVVVGSSSWKV